MWHLKLYKKSQDSIFKVEKIVHTLVNGFWLGVLSRESLQKIDEIYFNDEPMYYSDEYNKRGLYKWEREMLEKYFGESRHLLLIAAGGGREVYQLVRLGYKVDAYECHPLLKDAANRLLLKEGMPACVETADRDVVPESESKYDGAIIGWGAYMLIQGRLRRVEFMKNVAKTLKTGAPVLISFYTRSGSERPHRARAAIANAIRTILRRDKLEVGDDILPTYAHHFTEKEIREEFSESNFELAYFSKKYYGHAVGIYKGQII